ncbi:MAG: hypothetical protein WCJ74_01645, partial [bacterium]
DGTYFAAYGETPATVLVGGVSTPKNIGFVVGDTSIPKLNAIRYTEGITYLRTTSNSPITSTADIADTIIGVTNGSRGSYGGSSSNSGYALTIATTGNGTATANPIKTLYNSGEIVTIIASTSVDNIFSEWGGSCSGTGLCSVTMNGNKTVTAIFKTQTGQVSAIRQYMSEVVQAMELYKASNDGLIPADYRTTNTSTNLSGFVETYLSSYITYKEIFVSQSFSTGLFQFNGLYGVLYNNRKCGNVSGDDYVFYISVPISDAITSYLNGLPRVKNSDGTDFVSASRYFYCFSKDDY